jgi:hypothetical protein
MAVARWFDHLEETVGPVVAWGVAVALVLTALPAALLWKGLRGAWQQGQPA